jgi:hypothetical protein
VIGDGKAPNTKHQAPEKLQIPSSKQGALGAFGGEPPDGTLMNRADRAMRLALRLMLGVSLMIDV